MDSKDAHAVLQLRPDGSVELTMASEMTGPPVFCTVATLVMCHFLLRRAGLTARTDSSPEALAGVTLIALGLDRVFLSGLSGAEDFLARSRIGFALPATDEYARLRDYIDFQRNNRRKPPSPGVPVPHGPSVLELEGKLRHFFDSTQHMERYVAQEEKKYPGWTRQQLLDKILFQFMRERK